MVFHSALNTGWLELSLILWKLYTQLMYCFGASVPPRFSGVLGARTGQENGATQRPQTGDAASCQCRRFEPIRLVGGAELPMLRNWTGPEMREYAGVD
ncbi:hypothetical protein GJAV_G00105650 [Gymnothorax javanicus]|nr:hypothetical protein GJAV_G00105650 [Gymnothorax javanicus]